jgi:2-(1,2-epoxy-1,2-dihydrophenyl)acetyl-CoA isomerase
MSQAGPGFLAEQSGGILTITFNTPEQGNPIPAAAVLPLVARFEAAQNDPAIRCILLRGAGKHFSTGGNVANFYQELAMGPEHLAETFRARLELTARLVEAVLAFDRPIVAEIKGAVAGAGLLFALAADVVLADETAMLLFSHQRVGLTPDAGVSYLLPRAIGQREAKRLVLTAARLGAAEALRLGLIHQVVEADVLEAEAGRLAQRFAQAPRQALRLAKRLLTDSLTSTLGAQLTAETGAIVTCVADADFAEGVTAFIEKRTARFGPAV